MRKKIPDVMEEVTELKTLLKKEGKSWKKQRIQMLYLLKSRQVKTILELSAILAVNRNTIGRWIALYEDGRLTNLLEMRKPKGRALSISIDILKVLKEKLKEPDFFRTYKDIQTWLKEEYDLEIPYKTVHKIVKYKLLGKLRKTKKVNIRSKVS
jgi:transposase